MTKVTTWDDLLRPGEATDFFARGQFPVFDPSAVAFNLGNALWLAELSRLVYRHDIEEEIDCPQPGRSAFLLRVGLRQLRFFNSWKTDTQAMLVKSMSAPAFAVLAFRGTEQNLKDFIVDLEIGIPPLLHDCARMHEGFQTALESVWIDIQAELSNLECPLFYTGHSLGAALATIAASRRPPDAVYTFGSPRVGNDIFIDALSDIPIYRVVDCDDVVSFLPPELLGFRHVGKEYRLMRPSEMEAMPEPPSPAERIPPPQALADHAPINYVDRLSQRIGAISYSP